MSHLKFENNTWVLDYNKSNVDVEIVVPIINKTSETLKNGQVVFIEKKELHVFLWGKYRKYRWYHRPFFKKPIEVGIVTGVDTSAFKDGDRLYVNSNGSLTNKNK